MIGRVEARWLAMEVTLVDRHVLVVIRPWEAFEQYAYGLGIPRMSFL